MSLLLPVALFGSMLLLTRATPAVRLARAGALLGWLFSLLIGFVSLDSHLPSLLSNLLEGAVAADLSVGIAAVQGCVWLFTRPATLVVALLLLAGAGRLAKAMRAASPNPLAPPEHGRPGLWVEGRLVARGGFANDGR